jgi:hypothetical protein
MAVILAADNSRRQFGEGLNRLGATVEYNGRRADDPHALLLAF